MAGSSVRLEIPTASTVKTIIWPRLATGWSWLTDSLSDRGAEHTAAGGTVTRTVSCRFGQIEDADEASEVEVRASWTPLADDGGALQREYGESVPVVLVDGVQRGFWRIDPARVSKALRAQP